MHIGTHIKKIRKQKGKTLKDLSLDTKIDAATLSRIENGKMPGTVQSHESIAKSLGVRLSDIYDLAEQDLITASDIINYSNGKNVKSEVLSASTSNRKIVPLRITLKPKSRSSTDKFQPGTERFVYVLNGIIDIYIRGKLIEVKESSFHHFNASNPHYFKNRLHRKAEFISITSAS